MPTAAVMSFSTVPVNFVDAPTLADLCGQLGYPCEAEEITRRLAGLRGPAEDTVLVAEAAGRVVALMHVLGTRHLVVAPYAEVGGLVVDAAWRGRGVGAALLAAAEAWAAERGFEIMRIRSNVIREDAHRFYETHGYTKTKRQIVFARNLDQTDSTLDDIRDPKDGPIADTPTGGNP